VTLTTSDGVVRTSAQFGFAGNGNTPGPANGTATMTDPNGNQMSAPGAGEYTDSTGQSVLTGSDAGAFYTIPNATSPTEEFTTTYTNLVVQTAFGCSAIAEAGNGQSWPFATKITLPDGSFYQFSYEPTTPGASTTTGRIQTITLPTGGVITYNYNGSNNGISCIDGGSSGFTRTTPDGVWTYSRSYDSSTLVWTTTVTDPQGNNTVYTFSGRGSSIGGPACSTECTTPQYEVQRQNYQLISGKQVLMQTILTCYNGNFTNCATATVTNGSNQLTITQIDRYTFLPGVANPSLSETQYNMGMLTEDKEYDFVAALPPTAPGSNFTTNRVITYGSYSSGTCTGIGKNILNRPCTDITTAPGSTAPVAETTYQYDANGNVLSVGKLVSGTTFLTTNYSYYSTGLIKVATDPSGATTTYTYGDCNGSFPTNIAIAGTKVALSKSMTWNCTGEALTSATDYNNQATTYSYVDPVTGYLDPYWRVVAVTDALQNITHYTYSPTTIEQSLLFNSGNSTATVLSTADSQGRLNLTQTLETPGGSNYDTVVQGYDTDGRPNSVGIPCVSKASKACTSASTTTTYDNLGRITQTMDGGGGSVSYNYAPGGTYTKDTLITVGPAPSGENTKNRQVENDGLGRPTSVCEILSSGGTACGQSVAASGYLTSYAYSVPTAGGSQTVVTQGSQQRAYIYDDSSRLISETNPESGTTTYTYDSVAANYCASTTAYSSSGDLVAQADADGHHVCYNYDGMHRMTDVTNNAESSTNVCKRFRYDAASNGVTTAPTGYPSQPYASGRLVEAETDNCTTPTTPITDEWFSYNADGQMIDMWELTPHSGQYYQSVAAFYANGAVNTLQLASPSLYTITFGLDGEGRTNALTDTTTSTPLVTGATFFPAANPAVVSLAGTDNDSYTIDANTGRIKQFVFTVGNTPESLTGVLGWNANGTLGQLAITDGFNSGGTQTCSYLYDDLGRIGVPPNSPPAPANPTTYSVNCGSSQWRQVFSYDQYGNLTKTGNPGTSWTPGYSASTNHCLICTYDANGNVTGDTINNYGWDVYGKLAWSATSPNTASCGSAGRCATYDAFGRMVEEALNTGAYLERWITQLGETAYMSGTSPSFAWWPAPEGGRVLIYGNSASYDYLHADWLGNSRIDSSLTGHTITTDQAYAPFGDIYDVFGANVGQNEGFAGLTGMFFPGATTPIMWDTANRELSMVGRWLSPDPSGLKATNPANPQTWNRYSYVLNNPLAATDPTGLDCVYTSTTASVQDLAGSDPKNIAVIDHFQTANGPWVTIIQGDCASSTDSGYYVDGSIDPSTFTSNKDGSLSFGYMDDNGTYGTFSIADVASNGQNCDNACQLAQAINQTGVQTLRNPCTIGGFYVASTTVVAIPVATVSSIAGVSTGVTVTGIGAAEAEGGASAVEAAAGYFPGLREASETISKLVAGGGAAAASAWDWVKQKVSAGCNANVKW
jgi:YD repeat-containing protein